MHPKFADTIEVLKPMFQEINKTLPSLENYLVMGQICIAKDYRKQGIFRELYKILQKNNFPSYKSIITEVDTKNTRSLSAHYSVNFEDLKGYRFKEKKWKLIILR